MRLTMIVGLFLLAGATALQAQVKKGFKHLDKKKYDKAIEAFQKDLDDPEKSVAARAGIMSAYAGQTDFSNWLEGLEMWKDLKTDYEALDKTQKKELKDDFKVSGASIDKTYNTLCGKTLGKIEKTKSPDELVAFLETVPEPPKSLQGRVDRLKKSVKLPEKKPESAKTTVKSGEPVYIERALPAGSRTVFIKGINTEGSEFLPVLSADGKTLYYIGLNRPDNRFGEDIFVCQLQADGSWGRPKMDEQLSGYTNEGVISATADGNRLVLFIGGNPHIVTRTETGWSAPEKINLSKSYPWIGITSITRNGEALIFEAREGGSLGQIDIFIALRQEDGSWGEPFKLSETINTGSDDRSPFLPPDFKTLYFSSSGRAGAGGLDVFKTTRLDDTWKNWSEPENLGSDVNTANDDWGFCIPPSGDEAYLATKIAGYRDQDIVKLKLPEAARPEEQVIVEGALRDAAGKGIVANVIVEDERGKVLQRVATRPDGSYSFPIPADGKVKVYAEGENVLSPEKTVVDAAQIKASKTTAAVVQPKIEIVTAEEAKKGKAIELRNVFFDFAKATLRPESEAELLRLYQDVSKFPFQTLEIAGHTDNVGSEESNLKLSKDRAEAVRAYMISQGLPADKIVAKGYGAGQPIDANDTDAGRARNRRVEIRVQ